MRKALVAAVLFIAASLFALPTGAQVSAPLPGGPLPAGGVYVGATIGVTDTVLVNAGVATVYLDVFNVSNSATVCINFAAAATITGTQCAAGEYALPPTWHRSWPDGGGTPVNAGTFVPPGAIHAISSAASTPLTIGVK